MATDTQHAPGLLARRIGLARPIESIVERDGVELALELDLEPADRRLGRWAHPTPKVTDGIADAHRVRGIDSRAASTEGASGRCARGQSGERGAVAQNEAAPAKASIAAVVAMGSLPPQQRAQSAAFLVDAAFKPASGETGAPKTLQPRRSGLAHALCRFALRRARDECQPASRAADTEASKKVLPMRRRAPPRPPPRAAGPERVDELERDASVAEHDDTPRRRGRARSAHTCATASQWRRTARAHGRARATSPDDVADPEHVPARERSSRRVSAGARANAHASVLDPRLAAVRRAAHDRAAVGRGPHRARVDERNPCSSSADASTISKRRAPPPSTDGT